MRRLRLPLYAKILGWLGLNLALVVLLSYAFAARDRSAQLTRKRIILWYDY